MLNKKTNLILLIIVVFSFLLSIILGWYATAIGTGIVGVWFGIILFKLAKLDAYILFYLIIEVLLIWLSFALAYYELLQSITDAFVISIQNLFHFTIITPNNINRLTLYKILGSLEGFIGYMLVVSGVALLFKGRTEKKL